jgi:hypothetical protein
MAQIISYNSSVEGWPEALAFFTWEACQNESKTVLQINALEEGMESIHQETYGY